MLVVVGEIPKSGATIQNPTAPARKISSACGSSVYFANNLSGELLSFPRADMAAVLELDWLSARWLAE